jgi:hypothetical protein
MCLQFLIGKCIWDSSAKQLVATEIRCVPVALTALNRLPRGTESRSAIKNISRHLWKTFLTAFTTAHNWTIICAS